MDNKLVSTCIKILRILPRAGLHFNAIFRQTGLSYKPDVVKAVSALGKVLAQFNPSGNRGWQLIAVEKMMVGAVSIVVTGGNR